jgi:hypothetical protein
MYWIHSELALIDQEKRQDGAPIRAKDRYYPKVKRKILPKTTIIALPRPKIEWGYGPERLTKRG